MTESSNQDDCDEHQFHLVCRWQHDMVDYTRIPFSSFSLPLLLYNTTRVLEHRDLILRRSAHYVGLIDRQEQYPVQPTLQQARDGLSILKTVGIV